MGVTCGQAGTGERRDKVGVTQSVGVQQMWKVEGTEEVDSRVWWKTEKGHETGGVHEKSMDSSKYEWKWSREGTRMEAGNPRAECGGARLFSAACEMCVLRYRQHSSRDKPLGPPSPQPPPYPISPPTMLTQVCVSGRVYMCVCVWVVFVFTLDGGLRALYRSTCRGQQKRQLCVWEKQKT